jgi:hypothetical protein
LGEVDFGTQEISTPGTRFDRLKNLMRNNECEILIVDMCGKGRGFTEEMRHGLWELGVYHRSGTTEFSAYEKRLKKFEGRKIETKKRPIKLGIMPVPQLSAFVVMEKEQKASVGRAVLEVLQESGRETKECLMEFCRRNGLQYPDVSGGGTGKGMSLMRDPGISMHVLSRSMNRFALRLG